MNLNQRKVEGSRPSNALQLALLLVSSKSCSTAVILCLGFWKCALSGLGPMPPRKKAKSNSGAKYAAEVVAGAHQTSIVSSMDDLPPIMKTVVDMVDGIHSLRHCESTTLHLDSLGFLMAKDGAYPWPITYGGTFRHIAQRACQEPEKLIEMSAGLASKIGLCDTPDPDEFLQQYCKMEAVTSKTQAFVSFFFAPCFHRLIDFYP